MTYLNDDFVEGLKSAGRSIARSGGTPPSYTDACTYPKSSVIKAAYDEERKKMEQEKKK